MSNLQMIQQAIQALSLAEQEELRKWFSDLDAAAWDTQIEHDAATGTLDSLAAEALADYRLSKPREL
jgi:hypothetical protein